MDIEKAKERLKARGFEKPFEENVTLEEFKVDVEMAIIELAEVVDNAITEHENALVEVATMLAEMEG